MGRLISMQSLGVLLVGQEQMFMMTFINTSNGIQRALKKDFRYLKVNVGIVVEAMLEGDFVAKGEWLILVAETLFKETDEMLRVGSELRTVIGRSSVKLLRQQDCNQGLVDWHAVQSLSERILII